MKILFVQPPIEDYYDTSIRTYPLGLLYVAARVSDIAEVVLFDARTGRRSEPGEKDPFPELGAFYREGIVTPFSFFDRYRRFGLSEGEIRTRIEVEKPDVVAIASMCTAYSAQAIEVARVAKAVDRGIVTVLGGIHPTLFPERVLADENVDYCVRGEGETPFFELINALASGRRNVESIKGLCFRQGDRIHIGEINVEEGIDILPARRLVDPDVYRIGRRRYTFLLTSRGCPNSCGFCGKPPAPYRKRRLESVENEIEECVDLGIGAIDFEDDMLNLDRLLFEGVLGMLKGRGLTLSAMNGIYPGTMNEETLMSMLDAGFRRLNFSLVDVSPSVLEAQKRREHKAFLKLLPFLEASSFLTEVHFIIGLPGQTPKSALDTISFLMEKRLLLGPSVFYIAPGSPLAREAGRGGEIPFRSMRSSVMLPFNPMFPRPVTFTFVKLVRFINYVKQLLDREAGLMRLSDLPGASALAKDQRKRGCVEALLREHRFVSYDTAASAFRDDPVDSGVVRTFFERAKGSTIRGFKTGNALIVDV